jgi:hypothetical protein
MLSVHFYLALWILWFLSKTIFCQVSESGVSHACKRAKAKMKRNKKLKRKILKIEGKLSRSRFKN